MGKLFKKLQANLSEEPGPTYTPSMQFSSGSTSPLGAGQGPGAPLTEEEAWGSIKALVSASDGSMWVGYKRGLLERYNEEGKLLWQGREFGLGITALEASGGDVWVGGKDGTVWVYDVATQQLQRRFKAHVFPVVTFASAGAVMYSLAADGGIRGWPAVAAGSQVVVDWRRQMEEDCLEEQKLKILVGTWNVAEGKPSRAALATWLRDRAKGAHIVVIGLQVSW